MINKTTHSLTYLLTDIIVAYAALHYAAQPKRLYSNKQDLDVVGVVQDKGDQV